MSTLLCALFVGTCAVPAARADYYRYFSRTVPFAGKALGPATRYVPGTGIASVYAMGVQGYAKSGWEIGRMQSMRRYRTDPGPYPGFRRAMGW